MIPKLARIFFELFQLPPVDFNDKINPDQVPKWDSIGHMQLVAALEKEFDIKLSVSEIMEMMDVEGIISTLQKHGITE